MFNRLSLVLLMLISGSLVHAVELDPTKPFNQISVEQANINQHFVLYSIIRNGSSASAIINEQTLGVGDFIGDYQVSDIQQNQVILSNSEETLALSLFSNDLIK